MNGKEMAAIELLRIVEKAEALQKATINARTKSPKRYFFALYQECLDVVNGENVDVTIAKFEEPEK